MNIVQCKLQQQRSFNKSAENFYGTWKQCNMWTTLCSLFQLGKEGWQLSSFRMVCAEALQVSTLGLIHLDGLEEGLEVASTETLRQKACAHSILAWVVSQHTNIRTRKSPQVLGPYTIWYNFIAKRQYTDCTRNVLWCQVHSSHIHSDHKTFNHNNSK